MVKHFFIFIFETRFRIVHYTLEDDQRVSELSAFMGALNVSGLTIKLRLDESKSSIWCRFGVKFNTCMYLLENDRQIN